MTSRRLTAFIPSIAITSLALSACGETAITPTANTIPSTLAPTSTATHAPDMVHPFAASEYIDPLSPTSPKMPQTSSAAVPVVQEVPASNVEQADAPAASEAEVGAVTPGAHPSDGNAGQSDGNHEDQIVQGVNPPNIPIPAPDTPIDQVPAPDEPPVSDAAPAEAVETN